MNGNKKLEHLRTTNCSNSNAPNFTHRSTSNVLIAVAPLNVAIIIDIFKISFILTSVVVAPLNVAVAPLTSLLLTVQLVWRDYKDAL